MTADTYRRLSFALVLGIVVSNVVDHPVFSALVFAAAVALAVVGREHLRGPRCKGCGRRLWFWTRRSYCNHCSTSVSE